MSIVHLRQAKTQLSRRLAQVERGEKVSIVRSDEPVTRLVSCRPPAKRQFGALRGQIWIDDRFFEPLPEDELVAWEA